MPNKEIVSFFAQQLTKASYLAKKDSTDTRNSSTVGSFWTFLQEKQSGTPGHALWSLATATDVIVVAVSDDAKFTQKQEHGVDPSIAYEWPA